MRKIKSCLLLLMALFALSASSQEIPVDTLVNRFRIQVYNYPQEKVHLTTDRSSYFCGDTIWFRGFVVDASTHVPVNASKYLYVELVNPFDSIANRVKVMESDGVYQGYIPVEPMCAEGDYEIVAYTMFMENAGSEYFFRKPVVLTSPFSVQSNIRTSFERDGDGLFVTVDYTDKAKGTYKSFERMSYTTCDASEHVRRQGGERVSFSLKKDELSKPYVLVSFGNYSKFVRLPDSSDDISVSFHPEGGYLIPGSDCRVAFKAIDRDGLGIDVSGHVEDSSGSKVCEFSAYHRGMGLFHFRPVSGEHYVAAVTLPSGRVMRYPLPEVNADASVIHLDSRGDTLFVSSHGRTPLGSMVLLQQRGRVLASCGITNDSPQYFLKSWFPGGVIQAVLVDGSARVLSERLFFVRGSSSSRAVISPDSGSYGNREKVRLGLSLSGYDLSRGSVAVSVTDDEFVGDRNTLSIDAQLLLQSDLSGHIEDPMYYFEDVDSGRDRALDILLLTQGWKRYDVPRVLQGVYSEPVYPLEIGQEICGEVRRLILRTPRKGLNVNVLAPKAGYSNVVTTDEDGRFCVNGFDYPEGTHYAIQVYQPDGDKVINFDVFGQKFPFTGFDVPEKEYMFDRREETDNDILIVNSNPSMREILLDEVVITGSKAEKHSDIYELLASDTYDNDYFKNNSITTLSEIVTRIPGIVERNGYLYFRNRVVNFMVNGVIEQGFDAGSGGTRIKYRGPDSGVFVTEGGGDGILSGSRAPSVKLSEIELHYPMSMIKRVDFLPPYMAVVFGSKGTGGGLIVLTLKAVEEMKKDYIPLHLKFYSPLGYQKPAEMYTPKYTVKNSVPTGSDLRRTVYWSPAVRVDDTGSAFVEFYSSDVKDTEYTVTVEGITDDGNIIKGACKIPIGKVEDEE